MGFKCTFNFSDVCGFTFLTWLGIHSLTQHFLVVPIYILSYQWSLRVLWGFPAMSFYCCDVLLLKSFIAIRFCCCEVLLLCTHCIYVIHYPWRGFGSSLTYGSTLMPCHRVLPSSFCSWCCLHTVVFIVLCCVDLVHCGYPYHATASLMCALSFRL